MSDINLVKNWKYYGSREPIGDLGITKGQFMTGNVAGILITPDLPSHSLNSICNAHSFNFPVRYKIIDFSSEDIEIKIVDAIRQLENEGCRFIVTSGGNFIKYRNLISNTSRLITFISPLQAIDFLNISISDKKKIYIVSNQTITEVLSNLKMLDINENIISRCEIIQYEESFSTNPESLLRCMKNVGGIIWDSVNSDFALRQLHIVPVYDMVVIVNLLKNVCSQSPYTGLI